LHQQGHREHSLAVRRFLNQLPPPHTDKERIAEQLMAAARVRRIETPSPGR
jgi:hypothetical protein